MDHLKELRAYVKCAQIAVAGGLNAKNITDYLALKPDIIIVGGGIVHDKDPAAAAVRSLTKRIREYEKIPATESFSATDEFKEV